MLTITRQHHLSELIGSFWASPCGRLIGLLASRHGGEYHLVVITGDMGQPSNISFSSNEKDMEKWLNSNEMKFLGWPVHRNEFGNYHELIIEGPAPAPEGR